MIFEVMTEIRGEQRVVRYDRGAVSGDPDVIQRLVRLAELRRQAIADVSAEAFLRLCRGVLPGPLRVEWAVEVASAPTLAPALAG